VFVEVSRDFGLVQQAIDLCRVLQSMIWLERQVRREPQPKRMRYLPA
jgi:hypothetical protein